MNKLEILTKALSAIEEMAKQTKRFNQVFNSTETEFFNAVWKLQNALIESTQRNIGDYFGCLEWFVYENEMGLGGLTSGIGKNMREIKTADDLLWLIELSGDDG